MEIEYHNALKYETCKCAEIFVATSRDFELYRNFVRGSSFEGANLRTF